ncbi:MAG TPA: amino acid ABC transporter permease [Alphaproteobacteria bacterium]|nr:amino acid ABC transporter permease [Alphaproteobacteria bacterium]
MSIDAIKRNPSMAGPTSPPVRLAPAYSIGSIVAAAVFAAFVLSLGLIIAHNPYFHWSVFGEYFFSAPIMDGIRITLLLTAITMTVATILGVLVAVMRLSRNPILIAGAFVYCWFLRGIPGLVQLAFWYNFALLFKYLGFHLGGLDLTIRTNDLMTPFVSATIALSLSESAYIAEIVRSGVLSVGEGQIEAARSLGMTRRETLSRIILPQALRVLLPPLGNQLIGLLKWTSLASTVGVAELMLSSQLIYARNFETIPLLLVAAAWYLIITTIFSIGQRQIEHRYAEGNSHR